MTIHISWHVVLIVGGVIGLLGLGIVIGMAIVSKAVMDGFYR